MGLTVGPPSVIVGSGAGSGGLQCDLGFGLRWQLAVGVAVAGVRPKGTADTFMGAQSPKMLRSG